MMATFLLEQPKLYRVSLSFMIFKIAESWIFLLNQSHTAWTAVVWFTYKWPLWAVFFCDSFINDSYGFVLVNQSEESNPLLIFLN